MNNGIRLAGILLLTCLLTVLINAAVNAESVSRLEGDLNHQITFTVTTDNGPLAGQSVVLKQSKGVAYNDNYAIKSIEDYEIYGQFEITVSRLSGSGAIPKKTVWKDGSHKIKLGKNSKYAITITPLTDTRLYDQIKVFDSRALVAPLFMHTWKKVPSWYVQSYTHASLISLDSVVDVTPPVDDFYRRKDTTVDQNSGRNDRYFSDTEAVFHAGSLYARFHGCTDQEYRKQIGAKDQQYGRRMNYYGEIAGTEIGYSAYYPSLGTNAYAFLKAMLNHDWYEPNSSGIEDAIHSDSNVSLITSELYSWGKREKDDNDPFETDEYYTFLIVNQTSLGEESYEVMFNVGGSYEGGEWCSGKIMDYHLDSNGTAEGELFNKWNEYAKQDLWGDGRASERSFDWRSKYETMVNHAYDFDDGPAAGMLGDFFGSGAKNAREWLQNAADQDYWRGNGESVLCFLNQNMTENDTVVIKNSELYGWYMGNENGQVMSSEEEFYELIVTMNSLGARYDIMIDMTGTYDEGEGISSLLVSVEKLPGDDVIKVTDTDKSYARGLINAPLNEAEGAFFERYSWDKLTLLGDIRYSDGNDSDWTVAALINTVGSIYCVVADCDEYVEIHAEADLASPSLQRSYYGEGIPVLGFWDDWAICICLSYDEENPVCGWLEKRYLMSEEMFAGQGGNGDSSDTTRQNRNDGDDIEDDGPGYNRLIVVNCDEWVSLREYPDTSSARLAKIPKGAAVDAYYYNARWYSAHYNGVKGYVLSEYLANPEEIGTGGNNPGTGGGYVDAWDLSHYEYRRVSSNGRGSLVFQKEPRGAGMKGYKYYDGDWIYVNVDWRSEGYAMAYQDGVYGYVDASYIDWSSSQQSFSGGTGRQDSAQNDVYDLSNYDYRRVVSNGRGSLVFQTQPRGSFISGYEYYEGDWIYVNINWRRDGYAMAYEDDTYGYVDASYIEW